MGALDTARGALTRQIGPLPVWGWGIAGVGGVMLGRYVSSSVGGTSSASSDTTTGTVGTQTAGSAYGLPNYAGAADSATAVVDPPTSNTEWRQRALQALIQAGYTAITADTALSGYLDESSMSADQRKIIDAALTLVGLPPNPPRLLPPEAPPESPPAVVPPAVVPAPAVTPSVPSAPADRYTTIVENAFQDVLGRSVDAKGLAYWRGELAAGRVTQSTLRDNLVQSKENADLTSMPVAPPPGQDPAVSTPAPAAGPVVAQAPASQTPTAPASIVHTVASGETLSGIGRKYGVSWQSIYDQNRSVIGSNPSLIKPGQKLTIPSK